MTRKDYVAIAEVMNNLVKKIEGRTTEGKAVDKAVTDLCELFLSENPRFDTIRFIEAVYKA